jgi:hypothetical protein
MKGLYRSITGKIRPLKILKYLSNRIEISLKQVLLGVIT